MSCAPTVTGACCSVVASLGATWRRIRAIARSSWRTLASRVCSAATARSAPSSTATSSALRPARCSCRGSRCSRAMATFSSSV
jgi:hypothetical protein